MPCFHPTEVMIRRKSLYTKRRLGALQVVPCGNCVGCRAEQGRQWGVRMMHEARMHESNVFVTLTYREEDLPDETGLAPTDLSGFIKRLRKTQNAPISFFGCGEYGERTQRPHYHALLFGVDFLDRHSGPHSGKPSVWRSESLDDIWGLGNTEGGSVTMASATYVAGYIRKKMKRRDFARANPITGELLAEEFARMSLRPAIGRRWIAKHWRDVYPRDFVVVDGVEAKPPRYYDKWMDEFQPDVMEAVRVTRYDEAIELTKYQLMSGEKIQQARAELFSRRSAL